VNPKDNLTAGATILAPLLGSHGFTFEFRDEGRGSGGFFAWGEFVREDRRLELHFRHSLGLVTYHVGPLHARHETYMKQLDVLGRNQYPGFSDDPLDGFRHLANDLGFAADFLSGNGHILHSAALKEAEADREKSKELMAGYVGDTRALEQMEALFRSGNYTKVLAVFQELKFPQRLTRVQQRIVEISRERTR
jgi:hypothetical protein